MNLTKILNYCTKKFSWLRCWKNLSFGFLELKYRTHGGETWHQGHRLCSQTEGITLESRHLSLVMPSEIPYLRDMLRRLAELLETTIDFDALISLADTAGDLPCTEHAIERICFFFIKSIEFFFCIWWIILWFSRRFDTICICFGCCYGCLDLCICSN